MTRTPIMKRLMTLFKKTHDSDQSYPSDLEKQFIVTKKTLGVGSFAVVKECIRRSDNRPFALKIILKKAIAGTLQTYGYYQKKEVVLIKCIVLYASIGKEHMLDSELGTYIYVCGTGVGSKIRRAFLVFNLTLLLSRYPQVG